MKLVTLSALCLAGMTLASVSVYSLTPEGSAAAPPAPPGSAGVESVSTPPVPSDPAHFSAGTRLVIEGSLGSEKLLRGGVREQYMMLEVRGVTGEKAAARADVNLAIVMDRSGSMRGRRIQNAMLAATAAVDRLHDGDAVSVITFDTATQIVVPPTIINPATRSSILAGIRGIALGGDTCISCGVEQGIVEIEKSPGKVSRIVVLSDGDANSGVRDVPGFRGLGQRARDRGISVTTVGVNVDYNERILGALAEESNGQHYFVEDEAALARAFEAETDALTRTLASGVEIDIDLGPGVELERVYDRSFRKIDRRVSVPLGTLTQGEVKTVLLKVKVAAEGEVAEVARVELVYRDLVKDEPVKVSGALVASVTANAAEASVVDPVVSARVQRSETATALIEANRLFSEGRIDEARRRLDAEATRVRGAAADAKVAQKPRAGAAYKNLSAQEGALSRVGGLYAPPAKKGFDASNPYQDSHEGKGAVRESNKDAFDMRR